MQYKQQDFMDRNYNAIDLAKFICAILVITIHVKPFGVPLYEGSIIDYLNFGVQKYLARIAVPFFFFSSGFLLFKKTSLYGFDMERSLNYAKHIFRLYIIWTILYLPIVLYGFFKNSKGIIHSLLVYIRNFIFNGSYELLWFLPALIFAVIVISLLLYKRIEPKYIVIVAACFYFIGLFGQSWFGFIAPLKEIAPQIWSFLIFTKKVIVTTRNGLFFGFIFVAMGMHLAFYSFSIDRTQAFIGFVLSMVALFFEVVVLKYFKFTRAYDLYLFLIPSTFFLFCFVSRLDLPDSPIYKLIRHLSTMIYFSHIWVRNVVSKLLGMINEPLSKSCLVFILTLVITLMLSVAVIKLSEKERFKCLKHLYS